MLRAKDFRAQARASLTGNWGVAILAWLIAGLILGAAGSTFVGTVLLMGPMMVGMAAVFAMLVRRKKPEIVNVFDGFKNFVNALVGGLLYMDCVVGHHREEESDFALAIGSRHGVRAYNLPHFRRLLRT